MLFEIGGGMDLEFDIPPMDGYGILKGLMRLKLPIKMENVFEWARMMSMGYLLFYEIKSSRGYNFQIILERLFPLISFRLLDFFGFLPSLIFCAERTIRNPTSYLRVSGLILVRKRI